MYFRSIPGLQSKKVNNRREITSLGGIDLLHAFENPEGEFARKWCPGKQPTRKVIMFQGKQWIMFRVLFLLLAKAGHSLCLLFCQLPDQDILL